MRRGSAIHRVAFWVGLLSALSAAASCATRRQPIPCRIPMRDGALLAADLYTPDPTQRLPVILIQTPYNKDLFRPTFAGAQDRSKLFASDDYAFLIVDWRGRFGSREARGRPVGVNGADGYDTVEWAATQPWCNGKVGTWGPSALGVAQYRTAEAQPPHLVCCVPMVATAHYRRCTFFPGGALRLEYAAMLETLGFAPLAVVQRSGGMDWAWRLLERRWQPGNILVPMLLIGGWYDMHADEVPADFAALRARGSAAARDHHRLLMGPWTHTGIDRAEQGELSYPEAAGVAAEEALAFFDLWLRGITGPARPAVRYFQMGENTWRDETVFPPAGTTDYVLYLHDQSRLAPTPPQTVGADEYTYDPQRPTPTVGGANLDQRKVTVGPADQRGLVESRRDTIVYTSEPLGEHLAMVGNPMAELYISSDRPDTDFAVRVCDVYPDGRSMLVTDGILRCRFRNGHEPELMTPGQVYAIQVQMPQTALTFLKGHRVRLSISSANYPRFDVNRNDGGEASGESNFLAHNCVYHDAGHASALHLPVMRPY